MSFRLRSAEGVAETEADRDKRIQQEGQKELQNMLSEGDKSYGTVSWLVLGTQNHDVKGKLEFTHRGHVHVCMFL